MNRLMTALVLAAAIALPAAAQDGIVDTVGATARRLQAGWAEGADDGFRARLGILDFTAVGDDEAAVAAARTITTLFEAAFSRSTRFELVERRKLATLLDERELAMSGLFDPSGAGEPADTLLAAADALLYGEVSSEPGGYRVTVRLADAGTGRIQVETFSVAAVEERIQAGRIERETYAAPYGLALEGGFAQFTFAGNEPGIVAFVDDRAGDTGLSRQPGGAVRYRALPWMSMALGFESIYGVSWVSDAVTWNMGGLPYPTVTGTAPFRVSTSGTGIYLEADAEFALSPRFKAMVGVAGEYAYLTHDGFFEEGSAGAGLGFGLNNFGPQLDGEAFILRLRAGFDFLVLPRFSLGVRGGFDLGSAELDTGGLWHITAGLPNPLVLELGGVSFGFAASVWF